MWLLSYTQILTLAVAGAGTEASAPVDVPDPIASRQTLFSIPFKVDRPVDPANRAAAVQLFVSTDRGASWSQSASAPPRQGQFLFRAAVDGEYWFGVRTLDRSNQLRPARIERPGLVVIVDTVPPKLALQARHGESGQITAQWQVAERHLDQNSLTLLYRSGPNLPWLNVATERQQPDAAASVWSGTVSWMPVSGPGPVEVRAEIADTAGNRDISYTQVTYDREPPALAESGPGNARPSSATSTGNTQYARGWLATNRRAPVSPSSDNSVSEDRSDGWHAASRARPSDTHSAARSRYGGADHSTHGSNESGIFFTERTIAAESNPPIRNEFTAPADSTFPAGDRHGLLPGQRSQMVNSKLFELGYDAQDSGHAGRAHVELWGTRDLGRTWRSYGVDRDGRSPILATVEEEGTYGFRITVSSGRDPVGLPPQAGDAPDMLITVDLTKPTARILSAEQTPYGGNGRITVRWDACDVKLAQRPVSLHYGAYPGGPWKPLAQDLDNTGQYEWLAERNTPRQIYLRLEVRDEAGNVGVAETARPITLTGTAPGEPFIRPVDESARALPKRYYLR